MPAKKTTKTYNVPFTATGHGTVTVEATSPEDARRRVLQGEGDPTLLEWEYDDVYSGEEDDA